MGRLMGRLKEELQEKRRFVVTCELVPGRGYKGDSIEEILHFAQEARDSRCVQALSLTDNAGGNPALSADVLGPEILAIGIDLMVHFSCKDMNRNTIESRAYALKRMGVTNLLVVSGDYPVSGFLGLPKPVFDLDSVGALHYLKQMNEGLAIGSGAKTVRLEPTDFFLGAVASPFKATEAAAVMQYVKLEKKIRAGADFLITQLGYDSRKFIEFIRYVRQVLELDLPVLGSVYVLSAGAARFMNRGEVPGCYVDDRLLEVVQEEARAPDKGKAARLERAARQVAILRGLGYSGAHIEGLKLKFQEVKRIVGRSEEIGETWRNHLRLFDFSPPGAFFLFQGGERFEAAGNGQMPKLAETRRRRVISLTFWLTRLLHRLLFIPGRPGFRMMQALSRFVADKPVAYRVFRFLELAAKKTLFDCRQCDDCALFETYYICPESRCPKGQRNGPCGGSRINGNCEVFEQRACIWELVYRRAANRGELEKLATLVPPRNWKLYETSSWVNYFLRYDHTGIELPIPRAVRPAEKERTRFR